MGALYRDVYDDVVRCAQRKRERDALLRQLQAVRGQLVAQRFEWTRLAQERARVDDDLARLTGRSLLAVVTRLAGTRTRRLEVARLHCVAAQVRHDAQRQRVDTLQGELDEIERALAPYDGIDAEYQRVFLDKAHDLVARGGPTGARVGELSAHLVDARAHAHELQDALTSGQAALRAVVAARRTFTPDESVELGREADRKTERHLADASLWAERLAEALGKLQVWHATQTAIAEQLLHYVHDLTRNALHPWSRSRTRAAMDGLRGYLELHLRRLETTRRSVVATHDATEERYIAIVALG